MEGRSEGKRRITIREAATLLDVHPNTVRNRIKDGSIEAEKVLTERGPTWMIDPDSLTTNAPPSASQQLVGRVSEEALTILAREIVREAGLGGEERGTLLRLRQLDESLKRRDRITDAMRAHWNFRFEIAKHMAAVGGVLFVGLGAFVGVFYPDPLWPFLAYVAAVLLAFAVMFSIVLMLQVSTISLQAVDMESSLLKVSSSQDQEAPSVEEEIRLKGVQMDRSIKRFSRWSEVTFLLLGGGAVFFLVFAYYNLTGGGWP